MESIKIRITLMEELLGTASGDPQIHQQYVASKAPNAKSIKEEVEAIGIDGVVEKTRTVFPRDSHGNPIVWDYQIKGFFKDACGMLHRSPGTKSSKIAAYRKIIDGLVFVSPRQITLSLPENGVIGECQRPLRASTAQGERIALANSETVPAQTTLEVEILYLPIKGGNLKECILRECIEEWLEYGQLRGLGQWRNSGKGRFSYEVLE